MKKLNLLLLIIVTVFAFSAFKCGKTSGGNNNDSDIITKIAKNGNGLIITSRENTQTTVNGARIFGKFAVSNEQLIAAESGLKTAFEAARADGLKNKLIYSFFEIFTPPYSCIPSPEMRTPSFLVRGDAYDGSEFDQYNPRGKNVRDGIGVVYAAEMILSVGTDGSSVQNGQMYVCPDILENGARHGADHILLANNPYEFDGYDYFWCSINHTDGIDHPLLPRNGRCSGTSSKSTSNSAETPIFNEPQNLLTDEMRDIGKQFGVKDFEVRTGFITKPVK